MMGARRFVSKGRGVGFGAAEEASWGRARVGSAAGAVLVGRVGGDSMGVPNASLDDSDPGDGF